MNNLWKKVKARHSGKNGMKNLVISIVILVEILALCIVGTFAWVETVSSIKITNEANTVGTIINDTKYTDMLIGDKTGTIDLLDYFEPSGDMHLAPASSADGKTFYFPKANITSDFIYRKGNVSDKNTTYLSASFRLKADTNADFFFWKDATHNISVDDNIRVSVTAYTEGENPEGTFDPTSGKLISNTKIYANNASTTAVVNSTSGATGATTVEKFSDHVKGKSSSARLFAVGANETKYVTINVWLQKQTSNSDLTSNMSIAQAINNLGITSSLTPRHVTLLPTPTWDNSDGATFYAWCWDAPNSTESRLYKLNLDPETEHYYFDYNGTFRKTVFVRAVPNCTVQEGVYSSWPFSNSTASGTAGYWNQTVNISIPNDPVDPTFIIETINGGSQIDDNGNTVTGLSTGSWHDPATVKVAYVTGQDSDCGTLTATSYIGTTTSSHVLESTNSSSDKHTDTVHAWPGKILSLTASVKSNYAFVGWYLDAAGTTPAPTVNSTANTASTYKPNAPSTASEITYYAKFKETRTLTIYRTVDGSTSSTVAAGTMTVNGSTTANTATYKSVTVDKGSSVTFSATAATGYTFSGFYTAATDGTEVTSPLDPINTNTTYYARFTTNSYNVTANAYYSTNGGSSYSAGSTGGTVKAGTSAAGATSTASVKYKSSVNVVATAASGYDFDGWYSEDDEFLSADTTYTVSMSTVGDKEVFAKFKEQKTTTIYMTYRGYSKMRVYVYGKSTGREYNGAFPGSTVPTYTGNRGLYSYSFKTGQDEDIGIIVSDNGDDNIRSEYTAHIGETMLIGPSGSTINRSFTLGTKRYVYFTKNWTNNYIHYWGASSGNTSWPGYNMNSNKAYTNEYNQDVLYYVITTNHTKVIFHNNSGTQTGDTTLGSNSCFYFNGANTAAGTWTPSTD